MADLTLVLDTIITTHRLLLNTTELLTAVTTLILELSTNKLSRIESPSKICHYQIDIVQL